MGLSLDGATRGETEFFFTGDDAEAEATFIVGTAAAPLRSYRYSLSGTDEALGWVQPDPDDDTAAFQYELVGNLLSIRQAAITALTAPVTITITNPDVTPSISLSFTINGTP